MGVALALAGCGGSSSSRKVVTTPARTTGTGTTAQLLPMQQQHTFVLYGGGLTASCGSHNHPDPADRSDVEGDVDVGLIPAVRSSNPNATITLTRPATTVRAYVDQLVSRLMQCDPAYARKLKAALRP